MTFAPRPSAPTARPATAKQLSFLTTLCQERGQDLPENFISLNSREASGYIDALLKAPKAAPQGVQEERKPLTPPAHQDRRSVDLTGLRSATYLIGSTPLQIDVVLDGGKWHGWCFVKTVGRDRVGSQRPGEYYRGERADVLLQIVQDPMRALVAYALETGACGVCGRELSDDLSRASGIGPTCAKTWGVDRSAFKELADELRAKRLEREEKLAPIRETSAAHAAADELSWDAVVSRVEELDVDQELAGIQAASAFDEENPFDLDPEYTPPAKAEYVGPDSLPATPSVMDGDWA